MYVRSLLEIHSLNEDDFKSDMPLGVCNTATKVLAICPGTPFSPLTHTWKRSGKGWCAINGKSYGGLLTNTYKFVPRKVLAATCFRRALFGIGTEKLSTKKRHAAKPAIGIIEQR